jgi:small-conductance mechanosensitive channel
VPNSNFISTQVINWTLSEQRRRADLPVRVAYGTDPERVLKLLVNAASTHPNVMRDPEPKALCLGFGDGSLEFELRFWVPQAQMHQQVKSDLIVKVAAALKEAGIELPLPQREIRVKGIEVVTNLPDTGH